MQWGVSRKACKIPPLVLDMAIGKPQLRIIHLYAEFLTNRMYDVPLPCLIAQRVLKATFLRQMLLAKETPEKWSISDLHASCSSAVAAASKEHQGPVSAVSWWPQCILYLAWSENRAPPQYGTHPKSIKIPCFIIIFLRKKYGHLKVPKVPNC
jgi:hypothetical protein